MALRREYKPRTPGGETEAQAGNVTCPGHKGGEGSERDQVESLRVSIHPLSGSHWSIRVPALHSFIHLLARSRILKAPTLCCALRWALGIRETRHPPRLHGARGQQGWAN